MDLLILLVERRGQMVTRTGIVERLWGKNVFLDVDTSINTAIRKLRRALRDNPDRPTYIKTFTGKGYRFIAPVTVVPPATSDAPQSAPAPLTRVMLAVLPFENMSGDPEQEYFSDGLTEETISHLGRMNPARMGVIARTSTMAYKRTSLDIARIGRELAVDYVLESSVRREGTQVRITAQLIRVQDRTHLWADTYDRDATSVLKVQEEIGRAIASQIQLKLDPPGGALRGTTQDPDAHDLYLRGRYYWNQLTPTSIRRGIEYFQLAVARDPGYALAYAGLADSYSVLPITCDGPALEILPKAMAAARRAVELDSHLAEAHTAIGNIKLWMEWDWPGAEAAFRRAIELNSNYVSAHRWYGHLLSDLGRHRESAVELEKARQSDPLSPIIHGLSGHLLYHARQYDQALGHLTNALALNAELWVLHTWRGRICERKGMIVEAAREFQKAFDLSGGNTEQISLKGYIQAALGNRAEAEQAIGLLTSLSAQRYVPPYNIAMVYAGLSDVESALEWLERAYETRDARLTFLAVEPKWDFMRQHPRFQDLLRRLALPPQVVPWEGDAADAKFSAGSS